MKTISSMVRWFGLLSSCLLASCSSSGGGHSSTAPGSSGNGSSSAAPPSAAASSTAAQAPALQSRPPSATVSNEKVRYERAVAWSVEDGTTVVILADKGDCETLKPRRDASRQEFDKRRLDVVFSSQLDPDGTEHMRVFRIDPLAGVSGKMEGSLTGGGATLLTASFDLDFYEKEGPTILMSGRAQPRLCGKLPAVVSKNAPRPQPGLTVTIAGKSFPIQGALLNVFQKEQQVVLSTEPLSCGPDRGQEPDEKLLLVYGSFTQPNPKPLRLAGLSVPYRIEGEMRTGKMDMKVGSTKDKTTTASLDWTFEQGGYKGTVKGTVDLLVCRD